MRWPRTIAPRLRSLFRRGAAERELDDELRFHLDAEIEQNLARGMAPDQARYDALRRFGGFDLAKEQCRDARGLAFVETTRQDLAYAARSLARTPVFSAIAILTLAVGIGANTAIFSVVNAILLRPLPIPNPDRVVRLFEQNVAAGELEGSASPDNFIDWRARTRSFDGMASFSWGNYNLVGTDDTETIQAMHVTSDFFRVLGVQPAIGRAFLANEYPSGTLPAEEWYQSRRQPAHVVLAHGFWQRRFGGRRDIVGRTVRLGDGEATIVGVMPADFSVPELLRNEYIPDGPDCWVPEGYRPAGRRARYLSVLARVRNDVSAERAQADLDAVARQLQHDYPHEDAGWSVKLIPLQQAAVNDVRPQLRVLAGAVAFVLLIACANVANLLLVRTASRRRELAARAALGASRWRLARQLLTETMVVSAVACTAGLVLALWGVQILVHLAPPRLPRLNEIALDRVAFLFSVGVSLVTGAACGLVPALRGSAIDISAALKDEGTTTMGKSRRWFSNAMVVMETALALVLLIGAGLLARTFITLNGTSLGFRPDHVLSLGFNSNNRGGMEAGRAFYRDLLPRLEQTSGIEAVAIGQPPFSVGLQTSITPEGEHTERFPSPVVIVSPMYFRVLGIPLMRGRLFTATDTAESGPVTIISRSLAAKVWPGQDPIGRRITSNDPARDRKVRWMTVVGVVGDVRNAGLEQPLEADLYEPLDQNRNMDPNNVLVRTSGDPLGSLPAIRSLVHTIDKGRAVTRVATMEERLSRMLAPRRFNLFVIGVFSVLAFVLAVVGIYAVVSQTVAARTREVATRIALGASGARILVLVVRQNLIPIAAGEIIGAGIALGLNRLMQTLVFGVTTTDAPTYVAIGITWTATAVLACVIPASRAMRIDPVVALKCE